MQIGRYILMPILAIAVTAGQVGAAWQLGCVFTCCQAASSADIDAKPSCCRKKEPTCCAGTKQDETDHPATRKVARASQPCRCVKAPIQPDAVRTATKKTRLLQTTPLPARDHERGESSVAFGLTNADFASDLPPPAWVRNCALLL